MKLSFAYELYLPPHVVDTDTAMGWVRAAGFRCADMSIGPFCRQGDAPLLGKDWQRHAERYVTCAQKHGIRMPQAHCMLFSCLDWNAPDHQELTDINLHLLDVCRAMGIEYFVMHPGTAVGPASPKESLEQSARWLRPFVEKAEKTGVKLCLENMFHVVENNRVYHAFGVYPEELLELAERLDSPMVGFCWDTGHAHIGWLDQRRSIRMLGDRLWTTHVHDNRGQYSNDLHIPPFYGSLDWQAVMDGLREIGYQGTFNFELEPHTLPIEWMAEEFRFLYARGQQLLKMGER